MDRVQFAGRRAVLALLADMTGQRKAESAYRSIFQNAVVGIYQSTPAGRFLSANPALARILGFDSPEQLIAERTDIPRQHYVNPADRERAFHLMDGCGLVSDYRYQAYRRDGSKIWVSVNVRSVSDAAGRVVRYEGTLQDITEAKCAVDALAQSVSLLGATLESTADGILVVDRKRQVVKCNKRFAEIWKIPPEVFGKVDSRQLVALVRDQLKDPDGFARRVNALYAAPDREVSDVLEFKDGRVFERYSRPQRIGDRTIGRVWSFRDVTERSRLERRLEHEQAALRGLYDITSQPRLDFEEKVRRLLSLGCGLLDIQMGMLFRARRGGGEVVEVVGAVEGVGRGTRFVLKDTVCSATMRSAEPVAFQRTSGTRWRNHAAHRQLGIEAYIGCRVMIPGGEAYGTVNFSGTEPRAAPFTQSEKSLVQLMAQWLGGELQRMHGAEVRRRLMERLIAAHDEERQRIAHELHDEAGQALTSVLVGLRGVEDARTVNRATGVAKRLRRLTAQTIKDVGRLARGLHPAALDDLGLVAALRRYVQEYVADGTRVRLHARGMGSSRLPAERERALYRIAQEALSNAVRHGKPREIAITLRRVDGAIRLTVVDDGRGFKPKDLVGATPTVERFGIFGMQERAALLGGRVEVRSARHRGTTVSVTIPLGPEAARSGA